MIRQLLIYPMYFRDKASQSHKTSLTEIIMNDFDKSNNFFKNP